MLALLLFLLEHVYLFSYISGNSSFPQPLTADEERKYLLEYKQGSQEARSVLIERNLRLVAHIVRKYSTSTLEQDDLISIGTIGLIKAITTFDMDKGARLATYSAKCIENEVLMSIRATKKTANEVYLQDPIGTDKEGNEISLVDILPYDVDSIPEQIDLAMQIKSLYALIEKTLHGRERTVIELRYGLLTGKEKTQREIADYLDISRSYVSRIEKKALKKLYQEME